MAHLRGDVDDRAGLLGFDQPARHRLRDEIGRAHVERKDRVEILDFDVDEISRTVRAGIVDEDVERRRPAAIAARAAAMSVTSSSSASACSPRARMARRRFFDFGRRARRKRHMRAGLRQRRGRRKPDAAPGAGDERALAVEPEGRRVRELEVIRCGHAFRISSLRRLRIGHVAAAIAAHAHIGLLGVRDEAFEHAQPRAIFADHAPTPRR